jgi:hypothetical protein
MLLPPEVTFPVTRIRRGGYIFLEYVGDHPPRHVHVYRDGRLVLKWDLERDDRITGSAPPPLVALIRQLRDEGRL